MDVHLEDILIFSKEKEEHMRNFEMGLQRLK